jgi:hypothetical protein
MAVRVKTEVLIKGPVLTGNPKLVFAVTKREMEDMAKEGAKVARETLGVSLWGSTVGGGVATGNYQRSIMPTKQKGLYVAIRGNKAPPINTWLEQGTRRGKKLRGSLFHFRAAKQAIERTNPPKRVGDAIEKALTG